MTVATSTLLGRPLWYELMTTDMKAAETFYDRVVGWTSAPFPASPQPYTVFNRTGGTPVAGVMTTPEDMKAPPFWAMYVGVPKLEKPRHTSSDLAAASVPRSSTCRRSAACR